VAHWRGKTDGSFSNISFLSRAALASPSLGAAIISAKVVLLLKALSSHSLDQLKNNCRDGDCITVPQMSPRLAC